MTRGMEELTRTASENIVACHLSKGSQFRWREDMSGGLMNTTISTASHELTE